MQMRYPSSVLSVTGLDHSLRLPITECCLVLKSVKSVNQCMRHILFLLLLFFFFSSLYTRVSFFPQFFFSTVAFFILSIIYGFRLSQMTLVSNTYLFHGF